LLPRGQAASLYPSSSGLEAAGRPLSFNRFPCSVNWKRRPGRPHGLWVDQLHQHNHSPADLWRSAIRRGHSGATLRSSMTTHCLVVSMSTHSAGATSHVRCLSCFRCCPKTRGVIMHEIAGNSSVPTSIDSLYLLLPLSMRLHNCP